MLKIIKRLMRLVFFLVILLLIAAGGLYYYINSSSEFGPVEMTIEPGTTVNQIASRLANQKVIKYPTLFRTYISAMGYAPRLRAGDYLFNSGLTPRQVTRMLLRGDFATHKVTIVEGWTVAQIEEYLGGLPFVVNPNFTSEFKKLVENSEFISRLDIGWEVSSLEGYLFPETYQVYKLTEPKKIIGKMVNEFKEKFAQKIFFRHGELGLSPAEVVTVASIIEKETGVETERLLIASVFYNRLKKGMLLQSDPTIIYGLKDYDGNIRKKDILNPHKYNTYVHQGLPPGPICNPGAASLEAALNPAKTDYLFFVSKNDGSHIFTTNLADHNRAVLEYQKNR